MDAVVRGLAIYFFLLLIFRISGKRSLAQITTFDFVLLLIVAEAVQQALLGEDFSVTRAFLLIVVLIGTDIAISLVKFRSQRFGEIVDGTPLVIVEDGRALEDRMRRARVSRPDVLSAARQSHGLERLEQVKYAVLESSGTISIIPRRGEA